ncbi:MAG: c-type cytochrome [Bradymonadaceae bacterium]|nr:c-type cytochrome [Lujinxingiaceae bacterium]
MKNATLKKGLKATLVVGGICLVIPAVYAQGIGQQTLERQMVPTPQKIERGQRLFNEQCSSCHGANGQGGAPMGERLGAAGFSQGLNRSGGLITIYNVIARGLPDAEHPVYNNLFFQDQWATAHFVYTLLPGSPSDSPQTIAQARQEAIEGVCDPNIRETIADRLEPTGAEQIELGRATYAAQCASCHGDAGRGDGPAAGALVPPPRNFAAPIEQWTNGSSPLAIFNTLARGIDGTSMPSYAHLPEEERWALTHYVRAELTPAEILQNPSPDEIGDVCRALSAPPAPPAISIDRAMQFLVADQGEQRAIRLALYGDPQVHAQGDPRHGERVYTQNCVSCHGVQGLGMRNIGPYGAFPPYLYLKIDPLVPSSVGGTYREVAQRVTAGPHATLPNMTAAALLSAQDWRDLQAYIVQFPGEGRERVRPMGPPAEAPTPHQDGVPTEEAPGDEGQEQAPAVPETEAPTE